MATVNVEISGAAVNVTDGLTDDQDYIVQAVLKSSGVVAYYLQSDSDDFPAPADLPAQPHILGNRDAVGVTPESGKSIWFWTPDGSDGVLVISEA